MSADALRVIGSLPVANVQALSETCNNASDDVQVPERYLSKDPSAEEVAFADDSSLAIPVMDLQKLLDPESSVEECAKLGSACIEWGFFQLINHGVPDEVIANVMKDVDWFFKQPLEAKKECAQQANSLEGYGQAFVVSENQKLDWADMLCLIVQPKEARDMRFWPTRTAFRDSVDSYSTEAAKLGFLLLEFMAKGVGADPASLRGVYQGQAQSLKVNYFPPCRQAADRVMGLSPHTDASGLTLVMQMSSDVQALQVKKDGRWVAVDVLDGAFVVNVGDVIEIMSNGKFTSVEHRAVIHPTKERYSVVLFFPPSPNQIVAPMPEFVKGDKERYESTTYKEFMKQYFAAKLDGREHLERLKLVPHRR